MKILLILAAVILSSPSAESIACYKCGTIETQAPCQKHPFLPTVVGAVQCQTCRTRLITSPNAGATDVVARGCAEPTDNIPTDRPCSYTSHGNAAYTTDCFCSTENCNSETISPPSFTCYTCTGAECAADPFNGNAAGISTPTCAPAMPCLTIRTERPGSVERKCGTSLKQTENCQYNTLEGNAGYQSTCYCVGNNCNKDNTSAVNPSAPAAKPDGNGAGSVGGSLLTCGTVLLIISVDISLYD